MCFSNFSRHCHLPEGTSARRDRFNDIRTSSTHCKHSPRNTRLRYSYSVWELDADGDLPSEFPLLRQRAFPLL